MELCIGNKIITTPIEQILWQLKHELTNGKLHDIYPERNNNIAVTCPQHKMGMESKPSCMVYTQSDLENVPRGFVHCWACDYKATLPDFISYCFEEDSGFGEEWLLERCEYAMQSEVQYLPEIELIKKSKGLRSYMEEEELEKYNFYHPYLETRKISKDVGRLFKIGYDTVNDMITFPIRDIKGKLLYVVKRSVKGKQFIIPKGVDKPFYLLYYAIQKRVSHVVVCEGLFDCLTLWTYGIPAIASMGSPSTNQIQSLKTSGIRTFILAFDNDFAGAAFTRDFYRHMSKDTFISELNLPSIYKDVNEADKDVLLNCLANLGVFPDANLLVN